jgi:hypothetical protein
MNRRIRLYAAVTLVALLVAGCGPCERLDSVTAPRIPGGSADYSTYVALGTSIGAGYQSGGLVYRHQLKSYPALFAGRVGATFTYPAVSDSGYPPLLQLVSLGSSPVIRQAGVAGTWTNATQELPYTNLCVPGAVLYDVANTARYATGMFPAIARDKGSLLAQAVSLQPTFLSFEFGANEVLGSATAGSGTPAFSVGQFGTILTGTLDALHAALPNTKMAIFTVPDVTTIPFVTTIKPYFTVGGNRVYFLCDVDADHSAGHLNPDDYVLLTASSIVAAGTGIPTAYGGAGTPLPGAVVLTATEAATLQDAVNGYNIRIRAEAATRGMAVVDLYGMLRTASTIGIQVGGARYTTSFITGGLISLDGIHPTDFGQGLLANLMVDAANSAFGSSLPYVDLPEVETYTASAIVPVVEPQGVASFPQITGLQETVRLIRRR